MILGDKITKLRKQNGWSQEELAEKLGISRQSVSKWESGQSMPDIDKIIRMSGLFGISTDYLLKDELEEISPETSVEIKEEKNLREVTLEEANTYMDLTERLSVRIAGAVLALILSPCCLILLAGLSERNVLSESMAGGLGVVILLLIVAASTAVLIGAGMQLDRYEYLEKEVITLAYGVQGVVEKKKESREPDYRKKIIAGVVFCILGVIPLLLAGAADASDFVCLICVDILLLCVACGVFLMIQTGCVNGSYHKLLQEGDYTPEKKEINRRTSFFPGIYWCIITAIYLGVSFYTQSWQKSWIIWPVAGVLFAALYGIVQAVTKRNTR
ncbi:MAG: helix-turn-helix domain-containing protein [Eubacterium sp.]|nr:helix-turn-helix domain-containing protein [Eubacterium sp.]